MPSPTENWIQTEVPTVGTLSRPVYLRSQFLPQRHIFPVHAHRWNQFVYATSGILIAKAEDVWYVISPEQALWVPTGVVHTTGALQKSEFRNLYIRDAPDLGMPLHSTVLSVTPLLRALIIELVSIDQRQESERYRGRVENLILDQLCRQPVQNFYLPWPKSPILRKICEELYADPADRRDLSDWGKELGASERTLTRRFEKELGIGLRAWRQKLRLFKAIHLLETQDNITDIALELGYSTPSAFTYMFRQEMGCPPSDWRRR